MIFLSPQHSKDLYQRCKKGVLTGSNSFMNFPKNKKHFLLYAGSLIFVIINETKNYLWRQLLRPVQKQPPEVFYQKGVLRNFAKFTGISQPATLFKKRLWRNCYPVNFA